MSYERKPIHTFADENATGLDVIPLGALISVKSTGFIYQLTDKTGIVAGTAIKDAGYRLAIFNNSLLNSFTKALFFANGFATLLSATATLLQAENTAGSTRNEVGGANVGSNAMFYGGVTSVPVNTVTLLSPTATQVQAQSTVGTERRGLAGVGIGGNALFYGGLDTREESYNIFNRTTLLSPTATLVQNEANAGTNRYYLAGALAAVYALFYAGIDGSISRNVLNILSSAATFVQTLASVGTARQGPAGASVGTNAMFYGGYSSLNTNLVTLMSSNGSLLQAETNAGTAFYFGAGANVGTNALFYTGSPDGYARLLSPTGVQVQTEVSVGTNRYGGAGASLS